MGETPEEALGPLVDPLTGEPIPGRNVDGEVGKRLRELEQANRRMRMVGLALNALAVLILSVSLLFTYKSVQRIKDCTTPGSLCRQEQDIAVAGYLIRLDESHLRIECELHSLPPPVRNEAVFTACAVQAKAETQRRLDVLDRTVREIRKKAKE